jgi:hypothetical protein
MGVRERKCEAHREIERREIPRRKSGVRRVQSEDERGDNWAGRDSEGNGVRVPVRLEGRH